MKNRFIRCLALFAITVVLSAAIFGAMPHVHPEIGGQEQESCTPCFLHQAVQPLVESGFSAAPQGFLDQPLIPMADLPVLSPSTIGWSDSRAPPRFSR